MGREAIALCSWQGQTAEVKALLESSEIILRGDIRARIPRSTICDIVVEDETLALRSGDQPLILELGPIEAGKWAAALAQPLPSLAQKLGIDAAHKAFLIGECSDSDLFAALNGAVTDRLEDAEIIIAILTSNADLAHAIDVARARPDCHIWCVYKKGKAATLADSFIRTTMCGHGFMDNKTSGVSAQLTATRYRLKAQA
jgi:hypothetical protein